MEQDELKAAKKIQTPVVYNQGQYIYTFNFK